MSRNSTSPAPTSPRALNKEGSNTLTIETDRFNGDALGRRCELDDVPVLVSSRPEAERTTSQEEGRGVPNAVRIAEDQHADALDESDHSISSANKRHRGVNGIENVAKGGKRHLLLFSARLDVR